MNYFNLALAALEGTERQLNELIQQALADRHYGEIVAMADLAKAISGLREMRVGRSISELPQASSSATEQADLASLVDASGSLDERADGGTAPRPKQARAQFPRFERDGERLVKLGWSSKGKRVYEHRVVREIVFEICRRLGEKASSKKAFKMEKLFPMRLENGDEIPTYQAYLVLKWLQQNGAVERRGKDGYVFLDRTFDEDTVRSLWECIPTR